MDETVCEGGILATEVNNTLTSKLSRKKDRLENELALIKRAQEILDKNPDLKELFDIVAQVRGL